MRIRVQKQIADLYRKNKLSFEVSLDWVIGYIHKDYSRQVTQNILYQQTTEYTFEEMSEGIIEQIQKKFNVDNNMDEIINFLCLMAFLLGGDE